MSSKLLNVSEFLSGAITPTVLGSFLARTKLTSDNKYIFTYFSFKKSKFFDVSEDEMELYRIKYCDILNKYSGKYPLWKLNDFSLNISHYYQGVFVLKNDLDLNYDSFSEKLSKKICDLDWLKNKEYEEERKEFIRGFFDPVYSIDGFGRIACDCNYSSLQDIKKLRILIDSDIIGSENLHFHVRGLESSKQKAHQFRLLTSYYFNEIGTYCEYKAQLLQQSQKSFCDGVLVNNNDVFTLDLRTINRNKSNNTESLKQSYLDFLLLTLAEHKIASLEDISELFIKEKDSEPSEKNEIEKRSSILRNIVLNTEPDKCVICGKTHTFPTYRKRNNKLVKCQYFECHHMISIGNSKKSISNEIFLDDINNMVKVCPECHRSLTGRAGVREYIEWQLGEMLKHISKEKYEYLSTYFNTTDSDELIKCLYDNLL